MAAVALSHIWRLQGDHIYTEDVTTLRDIARQSGTSVATVSRALNGDPTTNRETRQKILRLAAELGYRPNSVARALRRKRTYTLGLLIPSVQNYNYATAAAILQRLTLRYGYSLFLALSNDDPATDNRLLCEMIDQRVDGIAHTPCTDAGAYPVLSTVPSSANVPLVEVYRHSKLGKYDAVVNDDLKGTQSVAEYLISLGHRHIAMILGSQLYSTTRYRIEGVREAARLGNVKLSRNDILCGEYSVDWGAVAFQRLMSTAEPPSAVIVGSPELMLGVLPRARKLGIRIPEHVSIASIGRAPWYDTLDPSVTSFSVPKELVAQEAATKLLRLVNIDPSEQWSASIVRIGGQLSIGGSTVAPR